MRFILCACCAFLVHRAFCLHSHTEAGRGFCDQMKEALLDSGNLYKIEGENKLLYRWVPKVLEPFCKGILPSKAQGMLTSKARPTAIDMLKMFKDIFAENVTARNVSGCAQWPGECFERKHLNAMTKFVYTALDAHSAAIVRTLSFFEHQPEDLIPGTFRDHIQKEGLGERIPSKCISDTADSLSHKYHMINELRPKLEQTTCKYYIAAKSNHTCKQRPEPADYICNVLKFEGNYAECDTQSPSNDKLCCQYLTRHALADTASSYESEIYYTAASYLGADALVTAYEVGREVYRQLKKSASDWSCGGLRWEFSLLSKIIPQKYRLRRNVATLTEDAQKLRPEAA